MIKAIVFVTSAADTALLVFAFTRALTGRQYSNTAVLKS